MCIFFAEHIYSFSAGLSGKTQLYRKAAKGIYLPVKAIHYGKHLLIGCVCQ